MIGRTNSSFGKGDLSPDNAVIHVTAPAGSTITFSKGEVIVKTLGPEKSHVNARDNTLADWYYAVSSSNYGSWTVTATLGTNTVSKTASINSNKEYDLELYSIELWKNGDNNSVSGGWQFSARSGGSSTRAITSTALVSYSTDNYTYTFFQPKKIQTISRNTLRATITGATINSGGDNKNIAVGLTSTRRTASSGGETSDWRTIQSVSAAFGTYPYVTVTSASNTTINLSCDVSSVRGSQCYVGLLFGNAKGTCTHVWFE